MKKICALHIILLFVVAGCRSKEKTYDYKSHPFDKEVIARLPLYDSLSQVLLANLSAMQKDMKEHASFDYGRSMGAKLVNPQLPKDATEKINHYMAQLGDKYLTEFSVYKDSSIKYSVRDTNLEGYDITARERLSYLPNGGKMQHREPPNKDTILNQHWQYWIRFDDKPLF